MKNRNSVLRARVITFILGWVATAVLGQPVIDDVALIHPFITSTNAITLKSLDLADIFVVSKIDL